MGGQTRTRVTGKCLGRVVTEDDHHSVLSRLPRHPGDVLDVIQLSDLKRKEIKPAGDQQTAFFVQYCGINLR